MNRLNVKRLLAVIVSIAIFVFIPYFIGAIIPHSSTTNSVVVDNIVQWSVGGLSIIAFAAMIIFICVLGYALIIYIFPKGEPK